MMDLRRAPLRTLMTSTCLYVLPAALLAQDLAWPEGAALVRNTNQPSGTLELATGPFAEGRVPSEWIDGALSEQVWQIPGDPGDPATLYPHLREQVEAEGFEVLYTCSARQCGGFDFRYALPIAEGPDMHVDLGNFRYLSARRMGEDGATHIALTLSHGGRQGYAHLATLRPADAAPPVVTQSTRLPGTTLPGAGLIDTLLSDGRAVLDDLSFETGASALSATDYTSLADLGSFLVANPTRRVVLVGHTDTEGALDTNIALSEARARAVRQALISAYGVDPTQVQASGVGFLAPRAANGTEDGREANRRVEVVLADTE